MLRKPKQNRTTAAMRRSRLRMRRHLLEALEDRRMLTNYLVVDFTPDAIAGEYAVAPFASIFDGSAVDSSNHFLDYDGNNVIDADDAMLAARRISSKLRQIFQPYFEDPQIELRGLYTPNVLAEHGSGQGTGEKWLQRGQQSDDINTYVIYVGADSPVPGYLGFAYQAFENENNEFYGYVFAEPIRERLASGDYRWREQEDLTHRDFTNFVAYAIAHEFGHLLGLGHVHDVTSPADFPDNYHHIMNLPAQANPALARFLDDSTHLMEIGRRDQENSVFIHVNAHEEVRNSFAKDESGAFVQTTVPNSEFPAIPTYLSDFEGGSTFGEPSPPPSAKREAPFWATNPLSDILPSDVAVELTISFNHLVTEHLSYFPAMVGFPSGSLPLVGEDLTALLGLEDLLTSAIDEIDLLASESMAELGTSLEVAGFHIDHLIEDSLLATLLDEEEEDRVPLDFLRASRTYSLGSFSSETGFDSAALSSIATWAGIDFSGDLKVFGDAFFTVAFGFDTDGFYLLPGNGLEARIAAAGDISADLGDFGSVEALGSLGFTATTSLKASDEHGKLRLSALASDDPEELPDVFANYSQVQVWGSAAADVDVFIDVGFVDPFDFSGRWVWDLHADGMGFSLDGPRSGFDTEGFFDTLADLAGQAINELADQANGLAVVAASIPFFTDSLHPALTSLISDSLAYEKSIGSAREYLSELGIELLHVVSPEDVISGDLDNLDFFRARFQQNIVSPDALSLNAGGQLNFSHEGTRADLNLNGQLTVAPAMNLIIEFGIDSKGGLYVMEGSSLEASLPIQASLSGQFAIGRLRLVEAQADGSLDANMSLVLSNFDDVPDERFYYSDAFEPGLFPFRHQQSLSQTGILNLDLGLTLSPAQLIKDVPIIGDLVSDALSWNASVSHNLVNRQTSFLLDQASVDELIHDFGNIEVQLRDRFLGMLDKYNPIPRDLRNFLTAKIDVLAGRSLTELLGISSADIFINPTGFVGQSEDLSLPQNHQNNVIELSYEFANPNNLARLLEGREADLFRLKIDWGFLDAGMNFPITPEMPLASFFGVINLTGQAELNVGTTGRLNAEVGLDTRGFYVYDQGPDVPLLAFTGNIGVDLSLKGDILRLVDAVQITGGIDLVASGEIRIPAPENASDNKIRSNRIIVVGRDAVQSTVALDLRLEADAKIGAIGLIDFRTGRQEIFNTRIFEIRLGDTQPGEDSFKDFRNRMRDQAYAFLACSSAWATPNPFTAGACAYYSAREFRDWVRDREKEGRRFLKDMGRQAGVIWQNPVGYVSNTIGKVDRWGKDNLGDFWSFTPLGALGAVANFVSGKSTTYEVPDRRTYSYQIDNGVLLVDWWQSHPFVLDGLQDEDDPYGANMFFTVEEDNLIVIAPPFQHEETVASSCGLLNTDCSDEKQFVTHRNTLVIPLQGLQRIVINGSENSDIIVIDEIIDLETEIHVFAGNNFVRGGSGRNTIHGGDGNDTLIGGAGDDLIYAGGGSENFLYGGAGNDELHGGDGDDKLFGGSGNDYLYGGSGDDLLDVDLLPHETGEGLDRSQEINYLYGGDGDDTLIGSPGKDYIFGGLGSDFIFGGGGDDDELHGSPEAVFGLIGYDPEWFADRIFGGSGNNVIYGGVGNNFLVGGSGNDTIYGGPDNDTIYGYEPGTNGSHGNNFLYGGAGDDEIFGGKGNDHIFGGTGADFIYGGSGGENLLVGATPEDYNDPEDGNNLIFGGDGTNTIYGGPGGPGLRRFRGLADSPAHNVLVGGKGDDHIFGGDGPDEIRAADGNNWLYGGGGDDVISNGVGVAEIWGGPGDDMLYAGFGDSPAYLYGGDGNDTLVGSANANDFLFGGDGDDEIAGIGGNNLIYGGDGNDLIFGGIGNNTIYGGNGDDTIYGDEADWSILDGNDVIYGGPGNDTIFGGGGEDVLRGGDGDDLVFGGSGDDTIYGGSGDDELHGDGGNDLIHGDSGENTIYGGLGDDRLFGGVDSDTIYGGDGDDWIDAGGGVGNFLYGGAGDDFIFGSPEGSLWDFDFDDDDYHGDVIYGGPGDDQIWARGGANRISAGSGNDRIHGGPGADLIFADEGDNWVFAGYSEGTVIHGGTGNDEIYGSPVGGDIIYGGTGDARIYGQAGANQIHGLAGNNWLFGGSGPDLIYGGDGNDVIYGGSGDGNVLHGHAGFNVIHGADDGSDTIYAGPNGDVIYGHGGNDTIYGGPGDDVIFGGDGDDYIEGGGGSDVIYGGAGNDILFAFGPTGGEDDRSTNYLFGDFGTGQYEADSGNDQLFGGYGNDRLFGEGGYNLIVPGAGPGTYVNFGSGGTSDPAQFIPPNPTPPPELAGFVPALTWEATLPHGFVESGRWVGLGYSAMLDGVSGSPAPAVEPAIAMVGDKRVTAWVDYRTGSSQILLAVHSGQQWHQLDGSAQGYGISRTPHASRRPTIIIDDSGRPIVAWTQTSYSQGQRQTDIWAMRWQGSLDSEQGEWVPLGSPSSAAITDSGVAGDARLAWTDDGPVLVWLEHHASGSAVHAMRYDEDSAAWEPLAGPAENSQVYSGDFPITDVSLATSQDRVAVSWVANNTGSEAVFVREFTGSQWTAIENLSQSPTFGELFLSNIQVSLAYHGQELFLAWQSQLDEHLHGHPVYAIYRTAAGWQSAVGNDASFPSHGGENGRASSPQLVSNGSVLVLGWIEDLRENREGDSRSIYLTRWNGSSFIETIAGDASGLGVFPKSQQSDHLRIVLDDAGYATAIWQETTIQGPRVYLRAERLGEHGQTFVADQHDSLVQLLAGQQLSPGDRILVTADQSPGLVLTAAHSGIEIIGVAGVRINGSVSVQGASGVVLQRLHFAQGLNVWEAIDLTLREAFVEGGSNLTLMDVQGVRITQTRFASPVVLSGQANGVEIHDSHFSDGLTSNATATGLVIASSNIHGGLTIAAAGEGSIRGNDVSGGLVLQASFAGVIEENLVHSADVGVRYFASAPLANNRIFHNQIGVLTNVMEAGQTLGTVPGSRPNRIHDNDTGVVLDGAAVEAQFILHNVTGVSGTGQVGGLAASSSNLIRNNQIGINVLGDIYSNEIVANDVGVIGKSHQLISNNWFARNVQTAVDVAGTTSTRVLNNVFVDSDSFNVHIRSAARETEVRNNVLETSGGYNIFVSNNSQTGFFSDYNLLHAVDDGVLVHWSGVEFRDILDWQVDVGRYDQHSRGTTVLAPLAAKSHYVPSGPIGQRLASVPAFQGRAVSAVDAGDPRSRPIAHQPASLLVNADFEQGLAGWTSSPTLNATVSSSQTYLGEQAVAISTAVSGELFQVIPLQTSGYSNEAVDSGLVDAVFAARIRVAGSSNARSTLTLRLDFRDAGGNVLLSRTVNPNASTAAWELSGDRLRLPAGTRSLAFRVISSGSAPAGRVELLDDAYLYLVDSNAAAQVGPSGTPPVLEQSAQRPRLYLRSPDLYVDWQRHQPGQIRWDSFAIPAGEPVRIELLQDTDHGPQVIRVLAESTANTGSFTWTPENSEIDFGTHGLRIQIALTNHPIIFDRGIEPFSVPEDSNHFFVNGPSVIDAEFATAAGSNRNTGRSASAPKPSLAHILDTYSLGANDFVFIDPGEYLHHRPLVIANVPGIGDDEGFAVVGADQGEVVFTHANPLTVAPIVRLVDADFVSLSNLTLDGGQYGLYLGTGSTRFSASNLKARNNSIDGMHFESGTQTDFLRDIIASNNNRHGIISAGPINQLENIEAVGNNGWGLNVAGAVSSLTESVFINNKNGGVTISSAGNITVDSITATGNTGTGIWIGGTNVDLSALLASGNSGNGISISGTNVELHSSRASGNSNGGISISGSHTVVQQVQSNNNGWWGLSVSSSSGLIGTDDLDDGLGNRIFNNQYGISASGNSLLVSGNTVYGHASGDGISGGGQVRHNVVHSNRRGIVASGGQVIDNRIYNNDEGLRLTGNANVARNTIYSNNYGIRANVTNYAGTIANNLVYDNSQYSLVVVSAASAAVIRNNTFYELGTSRALNVQQSSGPAIRNNLFSIADGVAIVLDQASQQQHRSDFNLFDVRGDGAVGIWQNQPRSTLRDWQLFSFSDEHSLQADSLFVNPLGTDGILGYAGAGNDGRDDDFHLMSEHGSFHGGSFAPVISSVTGLPVLLEGTWVNDAQTSVAIDWGSGMDSVQSEPIPNGGFINLGAYGGTEQASRSPEQFLFVTRPAIARSWPLGQSGEIQWRTHDFSGSADILLLPVDGSAAITLAEQVDNNGNLLVTMDPAVPTGQYWVSVVLEEGLTATSLEAISVTEATSFFYVNIPDDPDLSDNQYTTAPGSPANTGLTPDSPMASIQDVLANYNLGIPAT
jgi:Ca2+-binding RTX toxin-like protein